MKKTCNNCVFYEETYHSDENHIETSCLVTGQENFWQTEAEECPHYFHKKSAIVLKFEELSKEEEE